MIKLDKFTGCLIGGAAGDALGYAVEFDDIETIVDTYGDSGITTYKLINGVAQVSDDTQMTLFTADGLVKAAKAGAEYDCRSHIWKAYKNWLITQNEQYPPGDREVSSWLFFVPELFAWRAPGGTCLTSLVQSKGGTLGDPINDSKGCGGIMRVAPIGLFFDSTKMDIKQIDLIGAEAAALTHGHPLGWLPAAALVHIIARIVHENFSVEEAVKDMQTSIKAQFGHLEESAYMMELVDKAIELAGKDTDDKEAIWKLGEGWVAEETLAIAIYSALKYQDDFEAAIIAAVNHDGDSDSTGAVTGNIVGACLGISGIPEKFADKLELKDVIMKMAEDLYKLTLYHCNDIMQMYHYNDIAIGGVKWQSLNCYMVRIMLLRNRN